LPLSTAIAITAFIHLVHNLIKFGFLWKVVDWPTVGYFGIPAFLTSMMGAWLLTQLSDIKPLFSYQLFHLHFDILLLNTIVGLLLILFASFDFLPIARRFSFSKKGLVLGGVLSGFFGGLSGLQGAFRTSVLIRSPLSKEYFVGTSAAIASIVDIARLVIYGAFMHILLVFQEERTLIAVLTVFAFLGLVVGRMCLKKVTIVFVKRLVTCLLYVFGVLLCIGIIS